MKEESGLINMPNEKRILTLDIAEGTFDTYIIIMALMERNNPLLVLTEDDFKDLIKDYNDLKAKEE